MYGSYGRKGFKRKAYSYKGGKGYRNKRFRRASASGGFLAPQGQIDLLSAYRNHGAGGLVKGQSANRPEVKICRNLSPWPDRLKIKATSTLGVVYAWTTGVGTEFQFKANSYVDPWGNAGATQPYGYDQLSLQYGAYTVFAAQIMATFLPDVSSPTAFNSLADVCVWPSTTATSFSGDPEGAKQQPYGKFMTINTLVGGNIQVKIDNYMSVSKCFGIHHSKVRDDDTFSAAIASDPTNVMFFHLYCGPANNAVIASSDDQFASIQLVQWVELWSRKPVSST